MARNGFFGVERSFPFATPKMARERDSRDRHRRERSYSNERRRRRSRSRSDDNDRDRKRRRRSRSREDERRRPSKAIEDSPSQVDNGETKHIAVQDEEVNIPVANVTTSGAEISCSIEETNRIRALLGNVYFYVLFPMGLLNSYACRDEAFKSGGR